RVMSRTESRNVVEREPGTGRDDQVVVRQARAVAELDLVRLRMQPLRTFGHEPDILTGEHRTELDLDGGGLAPAGGDPRVRGRELEVVAVRDNRDAIVRPPQPLHFIGS